MTTIKHPNSGLPMELISSEEIGQAWCNIDADWPRGRFQDLYRLVKDTLNDCEVLASHYEDAARKRAEPEEGSLLPLMADLYGNRLGLDRPSQSQAEAGVIVATEADDEPARLREGGAL